MSLTVADTVDYKGNLADKSTTGGWIPAALSLGIYSKQRNLSSALITTNLYSCFELCIHASCDLSVGGSKHSFNCMHTHIVLELLCKKY